MKASVVATVAAQITVEPTALSDIARSSRIRATIGKPFAASAAASASTNALSLTSAGFQPPAIAQQRYGDERQRQHRGHRRCREQHERARAPAHRRGIDRDADQKHVQREADATDGTYECHRRVREHHGDPAAGLMTRCDALDLAAEEHYRDEHGRHLARDARLAQPHRNGTAGAGHSRDHGDVERREQPVGRHVALRVRRCVRMAGSHTGVRSPTLRCRNSMMSRSGAPGVKTAATPRRSSSGMS